MADGDEVVRIVRVLEYVGPRHWVEETIGRSWVPAQGAKIVSETKSIRSGLIGSFPEIVADPEIKGPDASRITP